MIKPTVNIVAILAGGSGLRMGTPCPKQFLQLGPTPTDTVLDYAVKAFAHNDHIDAIIVVIPERWLPEAHQMMERGAWSKVVALVAGGRERYLSSMAAIEAAERWLGDRQCEANLWIHDAARPLISQGVIDEVAIALQRSEAVAVGIAATDTLWQTTNIDGHPVIRAIPNRDTMMMAQTPQAFRLHLLSQAYRQVVAGGTTSPTDDCQVWLSQYPDHPILIVPGERRNLKVTTPTDLLIAKILKDT